MAENLAIIIEVIMKGLAEARSQLTGLADSIKGTSTPAKGLSKVFEETGMTTAELNKFMEKTGIDVTRSGQLVDAATDIHLNQAEAINRVKDAFIDSGATQLKITQRLQKGSQSLYQVWDAASEQWITKQIDYTQRFKMHYLSIMFFGMNMQRTFGNFLRSAIVTYQKTLGVQTAMGKNLGRLQAAFLMLRIQIARALEPIIAWLTPIIEAFTEWMEVHPELAGMITTIAAIGFVLGSILYPIATIALGIAGIKLQLQIMGLLGVKSAGLVAGPTGLGAITTSIMGLLPWILILAAIWIIVAEGFKFYKEQQDRINTAYNLKLLGDDQRTVAEAIAGWWGFVTGFGSVMMTIEKMANEFFWGIASVVNDVVYAIERAFGGGSERYLSVEKRITGERTALYEKHIDMVREAQIKSVTEMIQAGVPLEALFAGWSDKLDIVNEAAKRANVTMEDSNKAWEKARTTLGYASDSAFAAGKQTFDLNKSVKDTVDSVNLQSASLDSLIDKSQAATFANEAQAETTTRINDALAGTGLNLETVGTNTETTSGLMLDNAATVNEAVTPAYETLNGKYTETNDALVIEQELIQVMTATIYPEFNAIITEHITILTSQVSWLNSAITSLNSYAESCKRAAAAARDLAKAKAEAVPAGGIVGAVVGVAKAVVGAISGKRQLGGPIPVTGAYMLHAGEYIMPRREAGGGRVITFAPTYTITGTGAAEIKRILDEHDKQFLTRIERFGG